MKDDQFSLKAYEVFQKQYRENTLYRQFCDLLQRSPVKHWPLHEIPFLPIEFFKNKTIKTGQWSSENYFLSSGTAGDRSTHLIKNLEDYLDNTESCFRMAYGRSIDEFCWLALLPGYLENKYSSLIAMVNGFIGKSSQKDSAFYLDDFEGLYRVLIRKIDQNVPTILLGVTHALLEFGREYQLPPNKIIVMETGGMKGKGKELTRMELHKLLRSFFQTPHIHSEYGMTELSSQFYALQEGVFKENDRAHVLIRPVDDPFGLCPQNKTGRLDIIDLANGHSSAFIATSDLAVRVDKNKFKVIGRLDNSDIRGCNLLYN